MAITPNEARRVAALEDYGILDTPREAAFDELAALAAEICDAPIAVVNLIGADRQFFKAEVGLGVRETPLETSFCVKALLEEDFLLVPDATRDARFDCNPLVTDAPRLRFYAGALLKTRDGVPIGTLCVLDYSVRTLSAMQQRALRVLARQVMAQLDLRLALSHATASGAFHRAIVDSATDYAIIVTDLDATITTWNSGAAHILGWTEAEMLGRPIETIFTDQDRSAGILQREMDAALNLGRGMDERWHMKKGGARFWASGEMMPLRADDGRHLGFIKILRDRTEQRAATETLRSGQANIRLLLDSLVEGFYAVDRDGVTTLCNQSFLRMMGFAHEEDALGRKLHGVIHHSHPDGAFYEVGDCPIYTCASTGTPAHVMSELFFPVDGRPPLPVEYWAIPIIQDGELQGAICTFLDITERVAAEAERHASEARYQSLFNSLDVGFCIVEMVYDETGTPVDYRFVEANAAFERQTGLHDAVDKSMRSFAPDHEQHWFDIYGRVAITGESVRFEDVAQALDKRWYDVHAFRIGDPGAHQVAILFNDISDRRTTEIALQQLNRTLDARVSEAVAEREAALDALRQSQKLEAIGQLTGGVAHDFNNLLTVIRGSVDLLRRPDLAEDRRKRYLDAIADTSDRAVKLTSQLLAFARRSSLKPETFDVGASLHALRDMMGTLAGSRITVEIAVCEDICFTRADRSQFDTAIVNMAVNARDAMDRQGVLKIAARPVQAIPAIRNHPSTAGDYVAVSITDTGTGIGDDKIDHIFEPFFTTKGIGEGTGLGLSQVFGFAKQSGGEVLVESEVGRGTTFTLFLPRVGTPASDAQDIVPENGVPLKGACILVVEDNSEVGAFAMQALAELGHFTIFAADGAQALAKLSTSAASIDAVFSDVVMPGQSGIELGQEIRRLYPDLPVLLTSGYSNVLAQEGSHGFELLHKPYSVDELAAALDAMLRSRTRTAPAKPA